MDSGQKWKLLLASALSDGVPRRALYAAVVVGTVLNLINQGDAIFGAVPINWFKIDLSPRFHPPIGRVPVTVEPIGLGGATGAGREAPGVAQRSAPLWSFVNGRPGDASLPLQPRKAISRLKRADGAAIR